MSKLTLGRLFDRYHVTVYLIVIAAIILVNLVAYTFIKTEDAIYYWDISAYWKNGIDLLAAFNESFTYGWSIVQESLTSDYNYLPLLPLLPLMELIGSSRGIFTLLILNLYIVPFALITTYALSSLFAFRSRRKKVLFYATFLPVIFLFPAVLTPVFDGRVDAIAPLIMSIILLLYVKTRFKKLRHFILLGLLICLMFILRRYYSFWALGFFLSFSIVTVITNWISNNRKINADLWRSLIKPIGGIFVAGLTIIAIMLICFRDIFTRYIGENYADVYSAYHLGGFGDQFLLFFRNFGVLLIALMLTGLVISFTKYRKSTIFGVSLFITLQTIIIYFAFTYTQTFGVHHYYMLVPIFLWSFAVLILCIIELRKTIVCYILLGGFVLLMASLSLLSFTGERKIVVRPAFQFIFGLSENIRPIVRHDTDTLHKLLTFMRTTMQPNEYVYVVSSSDTFNDDIFRNINLPKAPGVNVSGAAHVDKRDGFPNYFFDAQYVIVADPIQTHIERDGQSVVTQLAAMILAGKAKNLQEIGSFSIDNNVTLHVFKKSEPYANSFIEDLRLYFANKYPDYPRLNNIQASGQ